MVTEWRQFWPPGSYRPLLPEAFPFSGSHVPSPAPHGLLRWGFHLFVSKYGKTFILLSIHVYITYVLCVCCFINDNLVHLFLDDSSERSVPSLTPTNPKRKLSHRQVKGLA